MLSNQVKIICFRDGVLDGKVLGTVDGVVDGDSLGLVEGFDDDIMLGEGRPLGLVNGVLDKYWF